MSIGSGSRIYQVAPTYAETGIRREDNTYYTPALFSAHYLRANDENTPGHKGRSEEQAKDRVQEAGQAKNISDDQSSSFPEIFNLLKGPDFRDLFLLSLGKEESRYMLLIRRKREERGVTSMLPLSEAQRKSSSKIQQSASMYLTSSTGLKSPKGHVFCGIM